MTRRAPSQPAVQRHPRGRRPSAMATPELFEVANAVSSSLLEAVNNLAEVSPGPLQPVVSVIGGDLASVVALHPTAMAIPRLGALGYLMLSSPNPLVNIIDFYITGPLNKALAREFNGVFTLRDKLGGGNFGITYEAILDKEKVVARELTPEQKDKRVVVKKVMRDGSYNIRRDLLKTGTLARGTVETGIVESYMCRKCMRFPLVRPMCARYMGEHVADSADGGGFVSGAEWMVWQFESDSTLKDALDGTLGKFPGSIADLFVSGDIERYEAEDLDAMVVKNLMKQMLQALSRLHKIGIVHRDVKPENFIITVQGKVLIIDFGAAVDFSTGINFNPAAGMLDYRYSPPEDLITPINFPKAPAPILAALGAPVAWQAVRPDLFDTFSLGVVFLQMAVPNLRGSMQQKLIKNELERFDYDLYAWREGSQRARGMDFSLLDRSDGAGFDLAAQMVRNRDSYFRGRISAAEALRHRYFRS